MCLPSERATTQGCPLQILAKLNHYPPLLSVTTDEVRRELDSHCFTNLTVKRSLSPIAWYFARSLSFRR